jgi:outer membrane lipopolysaccharide assembly protein LptE/RlpB
MNKGKPFPAVLAVLALAGCAGYEVGSIKPTPMAHVKTLAVPAFRNETLEPRVEVLLANTLIKQIQQDGTYKVADEKNADAILECTLEELERKPQRSVRGDVLITREYELEMRIRYRVLDTKTGKELMSRSVTGQTNFFASGVNAITADILQDERQALPLAMEEAATRLVAQISEGW